MRWFAGFGRVVRGLLPDRNLLRRRTDRVEAAAVVLFLVSLLGGVPAAAFAAGSWTYGLGVRAEQEQQADRHQVRATLQESAPPGAWPALVVARWTAPDGTLRTGQISVAAGAKSGSSATVWTDDAGRLQAKPVRHSAVITLALFAGIWAAVISCLLVSGAWRRFRRALDRRRMAAWDADWLVTAPRWTSNR